MNSTDPRTVTSPLIRRTFLTVLAWITPAAPLGAYLVGLVLGLSTENIHWALTRVLPPVFVVAGLLLPWAGITFLVRRHLEPRAGEPSSHRLARLQKLPWKLAAMGTIAPYTLGGLLFTLPVVLRFDKDPRLLGLGMLVAVTLGQVLSVPVGIKLEQLLMPQVLEERNRERARPKARGLLWLRQSWYLPYLFAVPLAFTLGLMGLVSTLRTHELRDAHSRALLEDPSIPADQAALLADKLQAFSDSLLSSMTPPLLALGAFTLLIPTLSAWMLARRQARAVAALQEALEGLANGAPFPPRWASTDELGDLATAMVALLGRLEEIPTRLQAAARQLLEASTALGSAVQEQRQGLAEQTAALQEAQTTSESIRTISMLAAQRADSVLSVASHAEQLGSHGETAIEETLSGLGTIRQFVDGIHGKVVRLQESAAQIGDITLTVKDLADQSNLLALNASIEAARSGEHGAGFGVVAWEIRKLADQSVRETARIRKSLLDIIRAIRDVASMSEQGAWQVEGGLERAKSSGDNLREMSLIIGDNAAAVRQIAAAVNQQNAGITQIFTAISQLSNGMETTVKRLDTTLQATVTLQGVIQEVMEVARKYQGQGDPPSPG